MLESGHRDLVASQPRIAPLRTAVATLLTCNDLDIAMRGDDVQQQCDEMMGKLVATKLQAQPRAVPPADWLFGLLLYSDILQPRHEADMSRLFEGISLVSQHLVHAANHHS